MPSLFKQHGSYYAQFYDSNRTPAQKRILLQTGKKPAAKRLFGRIVDAYALGEYDPWREGRQHEVFGWRPPPVQDLSVSADAVEAFLDQKRMSAQPSTVRRYKQALKDFGTGIDMTKEITTERLQGWLKDTWSPATKQSQIRPLKVFCRWLVKEDWLDEDPTAEVNLPRVQEQAPKQLTREEQGTLVKGIQAHHQRHVRDGRYGLYTYLMGFLQLNPMMGLRPKAAFALTWEDVNLVQKAVQVEGTKTGQRRTIPLSDTAVVLLKKLDGPSDFVYSKEGEPVSYWAAADALWRFREQLGLADHVTLYATRHAYGTRLAEAGVPVHQIKALMGHSTITVTQQYMHASPEQGQRYVEAAFGS